MARHRDLVDDRAGAAFRKGRDQPVTGSYGRRRSDDAAPSVAGEGPSALKLPPGIEQLQDLPLVGDMLFPDCELAGRRSRKPLGAIDEPSLTALDGHEGPVSDAPLGAT